MTAHPRLLMIAALRALAAFLEADPDTPAPLKVHVYHFARLADSEQMCDEIDQIATHLGTGIDPLALVQGYYQTSLPFGPITYRALAILPGPRDHVRNLIHS